MLNRLGDPLLPGGRSDHPDQVERRAMYHLLDHHVRAGRQVRQEKACHTDLRGISQQSVDAIPQHRVEVGDNTTGQSRPRAAIRSSVPGTVIPFSSAGMSSAESLVHPRSGSLNGTPTSMMSPYSAATRRASLDTPMLGNPAVKKGDRPHRRMNKARPRCGPTATQTK